MQEQQRQRAGIARGGSGGGIFDVAEPVRSSVEVLHGIHSRQLPLAGLTVAEVRHRFGDVFDLHPEATASLDGRPVDEDTRIEAGQLLSFVRQSGEKGCALQLPLGRWRKTGAVVTVEGERAQASLPEGESASVPLDELLEMLSPAREDLSGWVLPDGVKFVLPLPGGLAVVHQTTPRVHCFRWIAEGSPAEYGPGTEYREVQLALPYVITVAVFERNRRGQLRLGNRNECFFLNQGLDKAGIESELCFPALLNCSRFPDMPRHPLSWICTQHLKPPATGSLEETLREGLRALLHHLLETGFNRSSEHHELTSWFSETVAARVDPRLADVESWARASAEDPLFPLEVPWLPTGQSLRKVVDRIRPERPGPRVENADDLARLIFGLQKRSRRGTSR